MESLREQFAAKTPEGKAYHKLDEKLSALTVESLTKLLKRPAFFAIYVDGTKSKRLICEVDIDLVAPDTIREMKGYEHLHTLCSDPRVDMAVQAHSRWLKNITDDGGKSHFYIYVDTSQPYKYSSDRQMIAERIAARKPTPAQVHEKDLDALRKGVPKDFLKNIKPIT